jgi:hypothetical protein
MIENELKVQIRIYKYIPTDTEANQLRDGYPNGRRL